MNPTSSSSLSSKRKRNSDSFDEPRSYKRAKYDVFMNYSSKDIGDSFISHLRGPLTRNDFTISENSTGQYYGLKPVEDSDIYLVVFSSKYASSVSCLDELVHIMDCFHKFDPRKVFPVFFKVEPSDVRNQEGLFKEAFEAHETNFSVERVGKWRQAMKEAGQFSGHHLRSGDEGKFLRQIVKFLSKMKNPLELSDAIHPVGIEPRAQEIISKLTLGENVFTIVAVLGIGGSGKTTIVKAVYDRIAAYFDFRCFIENIHDYKNSGRNWKVDLQKEVISQLTKKPNGGAAYLRRILTTQKALLVLDDVDEFEQLQALGIHFAASFGCRSRIIVTTRSKQSLSILPYTPHEIRLLDRNESFELFTRLAFGKDEHVDKTFVKEIVWCADGLPLVLEVWGRHFKCHERKQWPSILETLKRIPHGDVQKKLQLSYDSLPDRSKKLFLDIVCFFNRMDKDLVVKVLQDEDSGFFPDIEIQYLVDKGLVKIIDNELSMHRAIEDMAKEVIRQEVVRRDIEDKPGHHKRLIDEKDVLHVLRDCSGTKSVEGIRLDAISQHHGLEESATLKVEAFKKMTNLRFIRLDNYDFCLQWSSTSSSSSNDDKSSLSFKKLKYLKWRCFPLKSLDNIDMGNVVVIILQNSKLEILWEGFKSLKNLRILDVSFSQSLTKTGNFTGLEKLGLRVCHNLEELDGSIGCLVKLKELNLKECTQLKNFPWEMIGKLTSLVYLDFRSCPCISNTLCEVGGLPDSLSQLHELKSIDLSVCNGLKSIPNLPQNMSKLQSLTQLNLDGCWKLEPEGFMKVTGLRNLEILSMRNCNVSQVSSEIGNLVSLEFLDLSENSFSNLPDSFNNLSKLVELKMNDCYHLQLLPLLPSNLTRIEASRCWSLDAIRYDLVKAAYIFRSKMLEESFFTKPLEIRFSGVEVPEWCSYKSNGHALSFVAPMQHLDNRICGFILCATSIKDKLRAYFYPTILNKTKEASHHFRALYLERCSMFVMFCPLNDTTLVVEAGDFVVVQFGKYSGMSYGLRLIYESDVVESELCIRTLEMTVVVADNETTLVIPSEITLSGVEVPEWCSYKSNGNELSFVAPMQHLDNKICGVILCATSIKDKLRVYFNPTILNKTKEISHTFYSDSYYKRCSGYVMSCPLNDTTLTVEAGDSVVVQFYDFAENLSCGLRLIYESNVVDSELCSRTLTVPLHL